MAIYQKNQSIPLKQIRFNLTKETHINLRELSATEMQTIRAISGTNQEDNVNYLHLIISMCAVDDEQNPIFENAKDVEENFGVGVSTLVEIEKKIADISGLNSKKN